MEKPLVIVLSGFILMTSLSTYRIMTMTPPSIIPKKPEIQKHELTYPKLPKETVWGTVKQDKHQVHIKGDPWNAEGFWHKYKTPDGVKHKLVLFWKSTASGEDTAPSLYEYMPATDKWTGPWGWEYHDVQIVIDDKDGISITGQTSTDSLDPKQGMPEGEGAP